MNICRLIEVCVNQYKLMDRLKYFETDLEQHIVINPSRFEDLFFEVCGVNCLYGLATVLKRYCGIPEACSLKVGIAHGVSFGDVDSIELLPEVNLPVPVLLSWGTRLADSWKKHTSKPVFCIGPPFCYAEPFYSNQYVAKERNRLGNNLLVFPSHSTDGEKSEYAVGEFIERIESHRNRFDSIRVCIFWNDIKRGTHLHYEKHGLECVTAGHLLDPSFLPRLRSLFEICDATLTNDIGSHVGFSVYMNKPVLLTDTKVTMKNTHPDSVCEAAVAILGLDSGYVKLKKLLLESDFEITDEIRETMEPYWGFRELKTKEELRAILFQAEDLYKQQYGDSLQNGDSMQTWEERLTRQLLETRQDITKLNNRVEQLSNDSSLKAIPGRIGRGVVRLSAKLVKKMLPSPVAARLKMK